MSWIKVIEIQREPAKTGITLFLACALFASIGCGEGGETLSQIGSASPNRKQVKVFAVKAEVRQGSIEHVGTLYAGRKVNMATELGGTIERLFFERGDIVRRDRVLAEISTSTIRIEVRQAKAAMAMAESQLKKVERGSRPEEIRISEAALEQAEAALEEAENNYERMKNLHDDKAVSNSDYDAAKRAIDTARADLDSAREQLALARQGPRIEDREAARANLDQTRATLAMAKDRLRKSVLRAPFDGRIAFRHVEEHEIVGPGTIITQVVDTRRMKLRLSLGERYIPVLDDVQKFEFTVDALPGQTFTGELTFLSPTADPVTRSFPLEFLVHDPDPRMADGMTVRVKFPIRERKKTIKLHTSWLSEEEGRMGVFVVENGRAVFRRVILGSYYEQKVEILSGLTDDELVITNPAGLKNGEPVQYEEVQT
ncbi:MAG: efflux RND transporter periplasmic adaptor subunit [Desulfobacteraceae bacterium]|jgi:multidrug efflux pump subunit AcrA (membrane-fusion protein)